VELVYNFTVHRGWKTRCARRDTKRTTRTNTRRLLAAMLFRRLASMRRDYAGIAAKWAFHAVEAVVEHGTRRAILRVGN
jgi:hypothetical protein